MKVNIFKYHLSHTHSDSVEIIVAIKLTVVTDLVKLILRNFLKICVKRLIKNIKLDPNLN